MSAAKHTPGPWVNHGCYIHRIGTDGKRTGPAIANTRVDEFITPDEEQQNARLIAAAPDMEQLLLEVQDGVYDADPIAHQNWLARVDAAILKATGGAS